MTFKAPKSASFGEAFLRHGGHFSDKWEHYLAIYDAELRYFLQRNMPVRLLEIGVQNGGSLEIWKQFLPEGSYITGLDVNPDCSKIKHGDGIEILIGDASDPASLNGVLGERKFDIIVDDGSHRSDHIIATFQACFDRLNDGGNYLVEDLHCSYLPEFGGGFRQPQSAIEWFKSLADSLNVDYFSTQSSDQSESDRRMFATYSNKLDRIVFYNSVVAVQRSAKAKQAPYRRILSGNKGDVVSEVEWITGLPPHQLATLVLSESAADAFNPVIRASLSGARETIAALQRAEANARELVLTAQRELATAQDKNKQASIYSVHQKEIADKSISELELLRNADEKELQNLRNQFSELKSNISKLLANEVYLKSQILDLDLRNKSICCDLQSKINLQSMDSARAAIAERRIFDIENSTTWQLTRPMRALVSRTPGRVRKAARRTLRAAWWLSTGRFNEKYREFKAAQKALPVIVPLPQPAPRAVPAIAKLSLQAVQRAVPVENSLLGPYDKWAADTKPEAWKIVLQRRISRSIKNVKLSVLVPVYRTPHDVFTAMIESVCSQSYEAWELCLAIVDTGADSQQLIADAERLATQDKRIRFKVLAENKGISANSNEALDIVSGEWIVLLDHDDILSRDALYEVARAADGHPKAVLIYSDKDYIDRTGTIRSMPLFKAQWSPDVMLNANYLTHLTAMRTERVREIGGWDPETDGAQDWDIFLRTIGNDHQNVVHIPKVLYHWRQIETSVSVGGFDAKPYAMNGQLRAIDKYLPTAGWSTAHAEFDGPYIRINWSRLPAAKTAVIVIGGAPTAEVARLCTRLGAELLSVNNGKIAIQLDRLITHTDADNIILLDVGFAPDGAAALDELVKPLENAHIAIVGGRVIAHDEMIRDFGLFYKNGVFYDAFERESEHYFGIAGGCGWYRNALATSGGAMAFKRSTWEKTGKFSKFPHDCRFDIGFCLEVRRQGLGRLLMNPFARFRVENGHATFYRALQCGHLVTEFSDVLANGDPYLNPNLTPNSPGAPTLTAPNAPGGYQPHDFANEARLLSAAYDAKSDEIKASVRGTCSFRPNDLKSMIWVMPDFEVPFYGGVLTILRTANHLYQKKGVAQTFAIMSGRDSQTLQRLIGLAFPELARNSKVETFASRELPDLAGEFDAAVCTLWVTAFPLLRMKNARRKFYFLQDWEPLFYPAGTTSSLVEATYRFGFHAICNTPSLATSYREFGGTADYFLPAVDQKVFHANNRSLRKPGEPFILVCYTRPGTSRNCFEALAGGLRLLKDKYGDKIEIISAGAKWDVNQFGLGNVIRDLGLLPYAETGTVYRSADAGLVAMATRHPSYLPFELMACGTAVVTNKNIYTTWLLRDEENSLLFEMTPSDIFAQVSVLIENPAKLATLTRNGLKTIESGHSDWDAVSEHIYECLKRVLASDLAQLNS